MKERDLSSAFEVYVNGQRLMQVSQVAPFVQYTYQATLISPIRDAEIDLSTIRFEWDKANDLSNPRKHCISFQEASQVFLDPLHIVVSDRIVDGERRWQALGLVRRPSGSHFLVQAAHTVQEESEPDTFLEIVRIISAQEATPKERKIYEDENG